MDVLVVGGSGFLGQELTRQARLAGDRDGLDQTALPTGRRADTISRARSRSASTAPRSSPG